MTLSRAPFRVPCVCHTSWASRITPPRSTSRSPKLRTPSETGQSVPSAAIRSLLARLAQGEFISTGEQRRCGAIRALPQKLALISPHVPALVHDVGDLIGLDRNHHDLTAMIVEGSIDDGPVALLELAWPAEILHVVPDGHQDVPLARRPDDFERIL